MDGKPWSAGRATAEIRTVARHPQLSIAYRLHARSRLSERGLILSDVLHALRFGDVRGEAAPATVPRTYRYLVECRTPNSGSRSIGVVVIPDPAKRLLTIVTIMWMDEFERRSGSILRGDDDE